VKRPERGGLEGLIDSWNGLSNLGTEDLKILSKDASYWLIGMRLIKSDYQVEECIKCMRQNLATEPGAFGSEAQTYIVFKAQTCIKFKAQTGTSRFNCAGA
jgi:hypothetical protein